MDWTVVIGLILFGMFLMIAEIVFVPGTTIVGILGFLANVYGVYLSYVYFGSGLGAVVLLITLVLNIVALFITFKGKSWERFSLKNTMKGTYNEDFCLHLMPGDRGKSISSLKPVGKALFNDREVEVRSNGGYINENADIEIARIELTKIFVQPVT